MTNSKVTVDDVINILKTVNDPEIHKDLVSLNMIKDVAVNNGKVNFTIVLTTAACPLKNKIRTDAESAVLSLAGVEEVEIKMDAKVRSDGQERNLLSEDIKNVVAIASGKGGVGKSTVAVNVAVALAQKGMKVGLLDADIYGPNVPTMMGPYLPPMTDEEGNKLSPAEAHDVKMMSIGFMVKPGQPLIWRGPLLHKTIQQFISDVEWGELDYLVIDLPPGTGDVQLSLAQSVNLSGGVIVTLPQDVSLEDAERGLQMFKELKVPVLGVVENMSYLDLPDGQKMDVFGSGGGEKLAKQADVPFLGAIPMDPDVRIGGDQGTPIVVSKPDSAAAKIMDQIAEKIAAGLSVAAIKRSN